MFGKKNQAFEFFGHDDAVTCQASAPVVGKTFVKLVAGGTDQKPMIATAVAGDIPYGVAAWDAAKDEKVTVIRRGALTVTAGVALSAGDIVVPGAAGKAFKRAADATVPHAGIVHGDAPINTDAAVALSI